MQIKCGSDARRIAVRNSSEWNGIDYLEVHSINGDAAHKRDLFILVHCFKPVSDLIGAHNIIISGGIREKDIEAEWVHSAKYIFDNRNNPPNTILAADLSHINIDTPENVLVIHPNRNGDFSTYTLSIVQSSDTPDKPADGFDRILSSVDFSFKVECPSEFDCACIEQSPQELLPEPAIDYMAKDYASFRKLILDRLSLLMPDWKERNPADIGVMLVELLAYVGDHLSYYQDAVATEAYLGTARSRISAARHARLLDYYVHNGCNARVWICFAVNIQSKHLQKGTQLLTRTGDRDDISSKNINNNSTATTKGFIQEEMLKGAEVFETMYDTILYQSKNNLLFYTWGETDCWLPAGSTSATINATGIERQDVFVWENVPGADTTKLTSYLASNFGLDWLEIAEVEKSEGIEPTLTISNKSDQLTITMQKDTHPAEFKTAVLVVNGKQLYLFQIKEDEDHKHHITSSILRVSDVLVFGERMQPLKTITTTTKATTSSSISISDEVTFEETPSLSHRHAICITSISASRDDLTGVDVLEIEWGPKDALPFSLCLTKDGKPVSIIYGNVVLADHGYTKTENLITSNIIQKNDLRFKEQVVAGKYYPWLDEKPLTWCGPEFEMGAGGGGSAASAFDRSINKVSPAIRLVDSNSHVWEPSQDILSDDEFARKFVVETDSDYVSYFRFSEQNRSEWGNQIIDDCMQNRQTFQQFSTVTYRIGNGSKGNVGAESITMMAASSSSAAAEAAGITQLLNPMPARGGEDPESIDSIRLHAPQAFRKQERVVTEADYETVLLRYPGIQKAAAKKRWTGSWYTMFVAVDRTGGLEVDAKFKDDIIKFLEKYRLAGYDIEIQSPIYVPLKISIHVCLKDGYYKGEVKSALLRAFSNKTIDDGSKGFFHPDNFTLGQALYLSKVYEAAMAVPGVSSVNVIEFYRWGKAPSDEIDKSYIKASQMEILRLDNDPNFAENGILEFTFCGDSQR